MPKTYRVAVIAGDGIGKEVVPEGIAVLEAAARRYGFSLEWTEFDWSCETYAKTGRMMPEDGLDQVRPMTRSFSARSAIPACPTTSRCGGC
jgi:tartrate dehydrogenase/decarboxylase/D-malate dehydrogenase